MEKKIHDVFEAETMPEDCVRRIEEHLTETLTNIVRHPLWLRSAAIAAAFAVVLLLGFGEEIITASAELYNFIPQQTAPTEVVLPVYEGYGGIHEFVSHPLKGNGYTGIPAEVRDGRLYFIENGEDIDITDLCSMDTAFIYTMQDKLGNVVHIVVGGRPDKWGYMDYERDCNIPGLDTWIGGSGRNCCGKESNWEAYGGVIDAKEKLEHPFPI